MRKRTTTTQSGMYTRWLRCGIALLSFSGAMWSCHRTDTEEIPSEPPDVHVLSFAAAEGDVTYMRALLKKYPELANATDDVGKPLLHSAAGRGQKEIVELLIDRGADVNAHQGWMGDGPTPLMCAALSGEKELFGILLKHGGFLVGRGTPFDLAFMDILALLLAAGAKGPAGKIENEQTDQSSEDVKRSR